NRIRPNPPTMPAIKVSSIAPGSHRTGRNTRASGAAISPTVSTPTTTLGGGLRLAARPAVKSATPRVAADASAAAGQRRGFRPPIVAFLYARIAMAVPEEGWFGKARDLHQRSHPVLRRVVVAVVGFVLLGVGVLLLVLPGPGLLLIAAGMAVLSLEFEWAGRLVDRARALVDRLRRRAR